LFHGGMKELIAGPERIEGDVAVTQKIRAVSRLDANGIAEHFEWIAFGQFLHRIESSDLQQTLELHLRLPGESRTQFAQNDGRERPQHHGAVMRMGGRIVFEEEARAPPGLLLVEIDQPDTPARAEGLPVAQDIAYAIVPAGRPYAVGRQECEFAGLAQGPLEGLRVAQGLYGERIDMNGRDGILRWHFILPFLSETS